jgi:hypothetical protein
MLPVRRTIAVAFAAALFMASAVQADQPLITDPAGDADQQHCAPDVDPRCTNPALRPPSEPSIDILTADLDVHAGLVTASVSLLDLDHPLVGTAGTGPEDGRHYRIWFSPLGAGVAISGERAPDGTLRSATIEAYNRQCRQVAPVPPVVTFDVARNTVHLEASVEVVNTLLRACQATLIERGTEFLIAGAFASVVERTEVNNPVISSTTTFDAVYDVAEADQTYTVR